MFNFDQLVLNCLYYHCKRCSLYYIYYALFNLFINPLLKPHDVQMKAKLLIIICNQLIFILFFFYMIGIM